MSQLLAGNVVTVTGGASGIGRAFCAAVAAHGAATVIVADPQPEPREGGASAQTLIGPAGAGYVFARVARSSIDLI